MDQRALVRAHELRQVVVVPGVLRFDHDPLGVDVDDGAGLASTTSPVSIAARYSRPVPTSGASVIISGTACRCMFAPISARFASLCSRNGISAVETDTTAGRRDVHELDLRRGGDRLAESKRRQTPGR